MKLPWTGKSGEAQAVAVLATVLIVSLGLCGLNWGIDSSARWSRPLDNWVLFTGMIELAAIVLSAGGLFVLGLLFIVRKLYDALHTGNSKD
jgi:hypothetical protein